MKKIHHGEKGLTLIELLIVIAILGIIAAVIIPNIAGFLTSGNVAGANTELENVKTASWGYFGAYNDWPETSSNLTATGYLSGELKASYTFDENFGWITGGILEGVDNPWEGIVFCDGEEGAEGQHGHWIAGETCPE
jgi:type IV pilus assembly protein PilA